VGLLLLEFFFLWITSLKEKPLIVLIKIDFSNMSIIEKRKTLTLLSVTKKQFIDLNAEEKETINSIIIEKENKDSKKKKYIAYPIIAAAGIGTVLFMLLIIAFSTY
jgi:hypothetical protein